MSDSTARANPAVLFVTLGAFAIVVVALVAPERFGVATKGHPFLMGFAKLFLLGTFGEALKFRLSRGTWGLDKVFQRALVWGVFGLWFTLAFPGFSALTEALVAQGLWPGGPAGGLWMAFSKSLWINFLGMFAWGMMLTHEYCNHLIRRGWRDWRLSSFAADTDARFALAFLPKTLLFWIPAHTFTFAMPPEWRVFVAALLAVALGFMLSIARRR